MLRQLNLPLGTDCKSPSRPGEWHRYRPDRTIGWEEAYIGIGGEMLERIFRPPFFAPSRTVIALERRESFEPALYELVEEVKSSSSEKPYSLALKVVMLLTTLFENRAAASSLISHNVQIRRATLHIAHHLAEAIDFPGLAERVGMGYSLFRRRFQEYTGLAPLEYQTSLRLRRACHLLSATDVPVTQIAVETGFKTAAYFTRFFRLRLNTTPTAYRRNKR